MYNELTFRCGGSRGFFFIFGRTVTFISFVRNYGMCVRDLKNCKLKYLPVYFRIVPFELNVFKERFRAESIKNKMNSTINAKENEEQAFDIRCICLCRTQNYKTKTSVVSV